MKKLFIFLSFFSYCSAIKLQMPTCSSQNAKLSFVNCKAWDLCSLDEPFIAMIARALHPINFVETGTFNGDTTQLALNHIPIVHTIELGKELHEKAKLRFKNEKNVILHLGDSAKVLPSVISVLKGKTLFFLDAHFSGGSSVKGDVNTPIITELEAIKRSGINDSIILVDDTRMFYEPLTLVNNTIMEGYPTLDQIIKKILEINPKYVFALLCDDLIAFLPDDQVTISPVVRATTISRLYDGSNFSMGEVIEAELCIAKAKGAEAATIQLLAEYCTESWGKQGGMSRHYPLWHGLILLANGNYEKAYAYLMEAKQRGINHSCIDWYIGMAQTKNFPY